MQARDRLLATAPGGTEKEKGEGATVKMMEMIGSNVAALSQKVVALSARVEEMVLPCSLFFFSSAPPPGSLGSFCHCIVLTKDSLVFEG